VSDRTQEALADLGARLLALVHASNRLGHETHKMTARYLHDQDPAGELVKAVALGRSRDSDAALVAWLEANGFEVPVTLTA
jgi:hypothetical protein